MRYFFCRVNVFSLSCRDLKTIVSASDFPHSIALTDSQPIDYVRSPDTNDVKHHSSSQSFHISQSDRNTSNIVVVVIVVVVIESSPLRRGRRPQKRPLRVRTHFHSVFARRSTSDRHRTIRASARPSISSVRVAHRTVAIVSHTAESTAPAAVAEPTVPAVLPSDLSQR